MEAIHPDGNVVFEKFWKILVVERVEHFCDKRKCVVKQFYFVVGDVASVDDCEDSLEELCEWRGEIVEHIFDLNPQLV